MPSPFPGMDPYLEQNDTWEDFHLRFIAHAGDMLAGDVGDNYLVKIEARIYVRQLSEEERHFTGRADAAVTEAAGAATQRAGGTALLSAPIDLVLPETEMQREPYLEVRDRRDRRVVTVLELLSPANKTPGADREAYLAKRRTLLRSMTHLVEIDLRRGGTRPQFPALPSCDYYALVSRYQDRPHVGLWPIGLRERLPPIPVPLTPPDADVVLDLQALLQRVYDAAGYGKYIYAEKPQPPLAAADDAWASALLPPRR